MVHLHYSPYQFATEGEASENKVSAKKTVKTLKRMTAKDKLAPKLMSCAEAREIPGSPNAFISPNAPDVMRTVKSVFGN
jgi:hypothetical protein